MKSLLLVLLGLVLISVGAQAAQLDSGVEAPGTPTHYQFDRWPWSMTQNADPYSVDAGTFTCGNTTYNYITDTYAMRRFFFADDGLNGVPFTVQSIDYFVRRFVALGDSVPGPYSIKAYICSIPSGAPFLFENMTKKDSVEIPITTADNPPAGSFGVPKHTLINSYFSETDTATQDMVVLFFCPITYYMHPRVRFALSAHNTGETWPSYYAFADCGDPEPVTPADLGSPGASQLALLVNGDVGTAGACCDPATGACTLVFPAECQPPLIWNGAVSCTPNPCPIPPPVPVQKESWGNIKQSYR
jgi:hypothetical protein